jgi:hypothetical protein
MVEAKVDRHAKAQNAMCPKIVEANFDRNAKTQIARWPKF